MLNYEILPITDIKELYVFHLRQIRYYQIVQEKISLETIKKDMKVHPDIVHDQDKYYLGIYCQNKLIGVIDYLKHYRYPNSYDRNYIFIGLFMIDEQYQNKGYGTVIMKEFLKNDYHYQLGCYVENKQGYYFWEKMGFQVIDDINNYHECLDLYVMER